MSIPADSGQLVFGNFTQSPSQIDKQLSPEFFAAMPKLKNIIVRHDPNFSSDLEDLDEHNEQFLLPSWREALAPVLAFRELSITLRNVAIRNLSSFIPFNSPNLCLGLHDVVGFPIDFAIGPRIVLKGLNLHFGPGMKYDSDDEVMAFYGAIEKVEAPKLSGIVCTVSLSLWLCRLGDNGLKFLEYGKFGRCEEPEDKITPRKLQEDFMASAKDFLGLSLDNSQDVSSVPCHLEKIRGMYRYIWESSESIETIVTDRGAV